MVGTETFLPQGIVQEFGGGLVPFRRAVEFDFLEQYDVGARTVAEASEQVRQVRQLPLQLGGSVIFGLVVVVCGNAVKIEEVLDVVGEDGKGALRGGVALDPS